MFMVHKAGILVSEDRLTNLLMKGNNWLILLLRKHIASFVTKPLNYRGTLDSLEVG